MSTAIPDKIGHVGETISWTVDLFIEPLGFIGADYSGPCGNHVYAKWTKMLSYGRIYIKCKY